MTESGAMLTGAASKATVKTPSDFGRILRTWLEAAERSQKELAYAIGVDPSTVSCWIRDHKRPDPRSAVKLLATCRGWLGDKLSAVEALDAMVCLGLNWSVVEEAARGRFQS